MLVSSLLGECEGIERAGGCAEMALGQVEVNGRYFKIAMAEQYLDSAQVGDGFKKVSRETVAQSMGVNASAVESCALSRDLAGTPENLGSHRLTGSMPAVAGKEPLLRLAP